MRARLIAALLLVGAGLDPRDAGPKLAEGAARFVADLDGRAAATSAVLPLLDTAQAVAPDQPWAALDAAEEAFLRATPGSPQRGRAAALVARLGGVGDPIARQATARWRRSPPPTPPCYSKDHQAPARR